MKIIFVSHSPNLFGSEKCLYDEINSFLLNGHDCILISPSNGRLVDKLKFKIKTYIFRYFNDLAISNFKIKSILKFFCNLISSAIFLYILLKEKPNFVYINTRVIFLFLYFSSLFKFKVIVRCHEDLEGHFKTKLFIPNNIIFHTYSRNNVLFLPVSYFIRNKFRDIYNITTNVLYQPVILENVNHSNSIKKPNNIVNKFNFVYIGSINKNKNLGSVVLIINRLNQFYKMNCSLDIYGEGCTKYIYELYTLAKFNLKVHNSYVDDVSGVLQKYNYYISASKNEAYGRILVEARLMGLTVFAPYSGGSIEIGSDIIYYEPDVIDEACNYIYSSLLKKKSSNCINVNNFSCNRFYTNFCRLTDFFIKT